MPISPATNNRRQAALRGAAGRPPRDRRGGFTLMEMVLALAIIGLIAALGLPFNRPHAGSAAVKMKVFDIVAMLRETRNAALRSGRATAVTIDEGSGVASSGISAARIHVPPTMAMTLSSTGFSGFRFLPDGRSSGGRLAVSTESSVFVIDVDSLTASVASSEQRR